MARGKLAKVGKKIETGTLNIEELMQKRRDQQLE